MERVKKPKGSKIPKEVKIYLRTRGDTSQRFLQIKKHLGLENDTEVVRALINWYFREHEDELQPTFEYFNLTHKGVLILDKTMNRIVTVAFSDPLNPGVWCNDCQTKDCSHTWFALSQPEIQEVLRKRREKETV